MPAPTEAVGRAVAPDDPGEAVVGAVPAGDINAIDPVAPRRDAGMDKARGP